MSKESAGKNRFFNLRGACAIAGIAALAVLLLPRSCGGSFDSWWGSGRPAVAESIRPAAEPVTALVPLPPVPAAGPEANREPLPAPAVTNVGTEPVPEPVRRKADRVAVPPTKPVPTGDARPARRRRQAPPAVRSFTFSPAGSGGWAQGDRFIRQGEFAILLLEAMRMPRPAAGWSAPLAACTLAADLGCGYDGIVAMRRQTPFLEEEIGGSVGFRNFRAPGKRYSRRRNWMMASIVLTQEHFLAFGLIGTPLIGVAWDSEEIGELVCYTDPDNKLHVEYDAAVFNEKWSGHIHLRFKTDRALEVLALLYSQAPVLRERSLNRE